MLEKCPDLRSKKRREHVLAILKDAYEDRGLTLKWDEFDEDVLVSGAYADDSLTTYTEHYHRFVLLEENDVIDSAVCTDPRPLIRILFRGRDRF
jgi:hypothetical protein